FASSARLFASAARASASAIFLASSMLLMSDARVAAMPPTRPVMTASPPSTAVATNDHQAIADSADTEFHIASPPSWLWGIAGVLWLVGVSGWLGFVVWRGKVIRVQSMGHVD